MQAIWSDGQYGEVRICLQEVLSKIDTCNDKEIGTYFTLDFGGYYEIP